MQGGSDEQLNRQATIIGDTLRAWWSVYWRRKRKASRERMEENQLSPSARQMTGRRVRHEQTHISDAHLFSTFPSKTHLMLAYFANIFFQCEVMRRWCRCLAEQCANIVECLFPLFLVITVVIIVVVVKEQNTLLPNTGVRKKRKLSKNTVVDNSNSKSLFAFAWIEMQHHRRTVGHAKSASKGIISLQID